MLLVRWELYKVLHRLCPRAAWTMHGNRCPNWCQGHQGG